MTRTHRARRLDTRIALLFAAVFAAVVGLTDALLVLNARTVETGRGLALLMRDAALLARLLSLSPGAGELLERIEAMAEGRFDAWAVRSEGGEVTLSRGLPALGLEDADLEVSGGPAGGASLGRRSLGAGSAELWAAWAPLGSGSSVLVVSRLSESREAVRAFALQLCLLSGLIAAVGFWAMLLVGASVTRPIRILTAAAARVARGELEARVGLRRSDELGTLMATFDQMAERIQDTEARRRRFLSSVSHELKTPLASMKALVEALLSGEEEPEELQRSLSLVNREIDRLATLVRSIVTRTRLDELVPALAPTPLREAVERIVKLTSAIAAEREAVVANEVSAGELVSADPAMLDELLLNLLDNAIRHGGRGTRVTVRLAAEEGRRRLEIRNTGKTIPVEALPHLFEPFFRSEPSRSRALGGGGLGLSIVQRIAELHGWRVGVVSGDGLTVFSVDPLEAGT